MTRFVVRSSLVLAVATALGLLLVVGCQQDLSKPATPAELGPFARADSNKSGAELWAQTCGHCHNLRSPSSYGPYQWEVAVYDMRVRAHLTGEEQRKITEFLKAASQ